MYFALDLKICEAGSYLNSGTKSCETCQADSYSMSGAITCTPCPDSKTAPEGSKSVNDCGMLTYNYIVLITRKSIY